MNLEKQRDSLTGRKVGQRALRLLRQFREGETKSVERQKRKTRGVTC